MSRFLMIKTFATGCCLSIHFFTVSGQTFTMGKDCNAVNAQGKEQLKAKQFQPALDTYTGMKSKCKTKDGKEASAVGLAEALNGLGRFEEAIKASDEALKVTKNSSLAAYFQKGYAQNKLKQYDASKASLNRIIELTEKNRNLKQRASNYALLAAMHDRQLGNTDSAYYFLDKAISLDSTNANFYIQKGDMLVESNKYEAAFLEYDKAVALGRTDMEMYIIRSDASLKMMENKYKTTNAQELRSKMTPAEIQMVCGDLKKALDLGWKNMNKDMFAALVCK